MKDYEVGQILFMTSPKSLNVLPVQIVEEVIAHHLLDQI